MKKIVLFDMLVVVGIVLAVWVFFLRGGSDNVVGIGSMANSQQPLSNEPDGSSVYGTIRKRGTSEAIAEVTVRAVNRANGETTAVQNAADGQYRISVPSGEYVVSAQAEGYELSIVESVGVHSHALQDIELVPKGKAAPPPGPGNPEGYIFGLGAQNEAEVRVILAVHGEDITEIVSIMPVNLSGEGLSVYYRDGQATAVYVGSFLGEPAWEVRFSDGRIIFVQRKCGNIVKKAEVISVVSQPSQQQQQQQQIVIIQPLPPAAPMFTPVPSTATPRPTKTPVPPTATSVPPAPTATPRPTNTPFPTETPTPKTLFVVLRPEPNAGFAPLNGVDLVVDVSGTAAGPISYSLDCTNNGSWERQVTISDAYFRAVDLCSYPSPGEFRARIQVIREGLTVEGVSVLVVVPPQ